MKNEMTEIEMMQQKMKEIKEQNQEKFMKQLLDYVQNFAEKSLKKDYDMTINEKMMFEQVCAIIKNLEKTI